MAGRLKNPTIKDGYISILIDDTMPANKKGVIVKNASGYKEKYFAKATGYDEIKGYLYFTTYEAGVLDTDNEFMKSEDIDFMHDDLMKNLVTNRMADINHDENRLDNVWINEIWKEKDSDGKTIASKGVYYIGENELLMQKAKEGKINGVSIMGRVEEIVDEPLSKWETMIKAIHDKLFGKEENQIQEVDMTKEELQNMTDEQLKELGLQRTETPPEEPKVEPAEPETPPEEPQELKEAKAEKEALEKQVEDLKKQVEKLEADNKELKKMKLVNKNEDGGKEKPKNQDPPRSFGELINRIGAENE